MPVMVEMPAAKLSEIRKVLRTATLAKEDVVVPGLVERVALDNNARSAISRTAIELIRSVRASARTGKLTPFLAEYRLSTREGIALMCLAEAMLRVPDDYTVDELIRDKIAPHDWSAHLGGSGSVLVNASTWALMLTGQALCDSADSIPGTLHSLTRRLGEPVIRQAIAVAIRELSAEFILGRDILEAINRGRSMVKRGYSYSFDMLGEAARTKADALQYFLMPMPMQLPLLQKRLINQISKITSGFL